MTLAEKAELVLRFAMDEQTRRKLRLGAALPSLDDGELEKMIRDLLTLIAMKKVKA